MPRICALLVLLVSVAWVTQVGGKGEISISVSPRVTHVPGTVRVRATVEHNMENRALQIIAESDDYYRSSTVPLDGEKGARITVIQFRGLPLGNYRVIANLLGAGDEIRATVNRDLLVSSPQVVLPH
jgi:hypothetical protein